MTTTRKEEKREGHKDGKNKHNGKRGNCTV